MGRRLKIERQADGDLLLRAEGLRSACAVNAALRWLGRSTGSALLKQVSCRRTGDGRFTVLAAARPHPG